ncbi:YwqJ-related putative deaminase [Streptomyces sp. NPDC058128]|uniref:YwqJ-related putative deaminase n=1 Tax=Streptomyces sp. NPDC058128 TaxID=3346352 RepID=UPI0036F159FC
MTEHGPGPASVPQRAACSGQTASHKNVEERNAHARPARHLKQHSCRTTSTRPPSLSDPKPDLHPAARDIYDQVRTMIEGEGRVVGGGHGQCAEALLLSDRLRRLDPSGTSISTLDQVRRAMDGAQMYTVQIGPDRRGHFEHNEYKPPCRSSEIALGMAGIHAHTG